MFFGFFFPPLKHNFNRRGLIFVETAFQKWHFSFLSDGSSGERASDAAAVMGHLIVLFSSELGGGGGGCKFKKKSITMTEILVRHRGKYLLA